MAIVIPYSSALIFVSSALTALVVILLFRDLFKTRRSNIKTLKLPRGSYGWPLLGETLEFLRTCLDGAPETFIKERVERYQSHHVFKTSLFGERVAVFCGASGNKFLFSNENKLVNVWWPASVRRLLGPCLATSVAEEAKTMRKMLSNFLNPDAFMRLYSKKIDLVTQQHIRIHWQGKEEVIVFPTAKLYTFELACCLFLSLEDPNRIAKLAAKFNIFLEGLISNPINFPGTRFYQAHRATAAIKKELVEIVRERRVALEMGRASPSQDLLSHLLVTPIENSGAFISETIIVNNILMLLFAGHDTSTSAITWLVKSLGEHPQVYDEVFKEQNEIASSKEGRGGGVFILEWEDIKKMKYSWNVICEVIRLTPSAIGAFREALTDLKYEGYDIPKGWKLYWSAAFTHRDANLFAEPTKFDPSRFEGEDHILTPFSYVSFGGGPRICIGQELAKILILTFLHHLVNKFRWNLVNPDEKIKYDPTPIPVNGLPIRLLPRTHP
ncbi:hypothetical protein ACH5RR_021502 [Cinchona calisaya]|uniref:Cytochrome P450 n=1 Tax=Cinchona calisaya TaxID=153742 RepID=A0ABD2ZMF9_9GENT